ncbi:FMN reductase [Microbacterium sp. 18062]|uniref:FMN reductase n=1 Tax=Microbacterium sp. 18062 TaxID=2681410 RepID=UPI001358D2F4|nr:FMN reductase [Microbacterium sp. 18062]
MSRPLRTVTVNGSYSTPSKTGALIELITDQIASTREIEVRRIEVSTLGPGLTSALAREDLSAEVRAEVAAVEDADLVIAGTPVFRGSYTGLFKHFFDFVDQYALANKPVMLVATGGSDRHALVIEHELRPLFGFFQAATVPVGIYASAGDFDRTTLLAPETYARIEIAVRDIVPVLDALTAAPATAAVPSGPGRPEGAGATALH